MYHDFNGESLNEDDKIERCAKANVSELKGQPPLFSEDASAEKYFGVHKFCSELDYTIFYEKNILLEHEAHFCLKIKSKQHEKKGRK